MITFNKSGYDPFIDFIKAYAIIMVVFTHCIPTSVYNYILGCLWIDVQVPLFLLIQVFHAYKNEKNPKINIKKMAKRIVLPFAIIQIVIFVILALLSEDDVCKLLNISVLIRGGYGPGSYYFWVYIEFAFLLRWAFPYLERHNVKTLTIVFIIISMIIDIICSITNMPEQLYRLLALRYVFLILLGYLWVKQGIVLNKRTTALAVCSILATLFFSYTNFDLEPLFFTTGWKTHRWLCYYFIATLFVVLLKRIYNNVSKHKIVDKIIREIGKCSYDIFLFQMAVFTLFTSNRLAFIENDYIRIMLWMVIAFLASIVGGVVFNKMKLKIDSF